MHQANVTLGDLIDEHIRRLNPLATVYTAVFQSVARAAVPNGSAIIYIPWGPFGRTITIVESPFEMDELGKDGPRGLRYYLATAAPDQETAMRYMVFAAGRLHTMMQLSANAAAFPIHLRLMTIRGAGTVPFRELLWEPEVSHHLNSRIVDTDATAALFSAAWKSTDERFERSAVQYELGLRRVNGFESPIGLAHLYMGVETITKAIIRKRCEELQLTEKQFGAKFGIDPDDEKAGHKLDIEVRRQLIFCNDAETYKNAKLVSDGLEHGFASWDTIWGVPDDTFSKTAAYVRAAILSVADLDDQYRDQLAAEAFKRPMEGGPTLAFEATAPVDSIDLRAADFKIASVKRTMVSSVFDPGTGEYQYEYRLDAGPRA
jgi:hypothetical protein